MSDQPADPKSSLEPVVRQTPAVAGLTRRGLELAVALKRATHDASSLGVVDRAALAKACLREADTYVQEAMALFWDQTETAICVRCGEAAFKAFLYGLIAAANKCDAEWKPLSVLDANTWIDRGLYGRPGQFDELVGAAERMADSVRTWLKCDEEAMSLRVRSASAAATLPTSW